MTPEKEKELLTALSKGNQSAFDSLYLFYAPKVREFVFRLLKNPGEAEDVTQNIFLRVWEKRRRREQALRPITAAEPPEPARLSKIHLTLLLPSRRICRGREKKLFACRRRR